tara:strand:- start:10372 stop:11469 length:1098 start_codon:yes stop_codon:yes gene_type:complete
MTFFNKKEEVIDIELTQFGKAKLSRGLFKPVYYAFYDDDILYDSEYGGFEENQNDIVQRIKETVRTKAQYLYYGIESEFVDINRKMEKKFGSSPAESRNVLLSEPIQPVKDKFYSLSSPLGNSSVSNQKAPQWSIRALSSKISGSIGDDRVSIAKIPQINIEPYWTSSLGFRGFVGADDFDDPGHDSEVVLDDLTITQQDQTAYVKIVKNHIVLEVLEENADALQRKNFDIEIFKVLKEAEVDTSGNITVPAQLEPLRFKKDPTRNLVVDGILIDVPESETLFEGSRMDDITTLLTGDASPTDVEYYFDFFVDEEIDPPVLCRNIIEGGVKNDVFSDLQIQCEEGVAPSIRPNIYRPEEYEDPCD